MCVCVCVCVCLFVFVFVFVCVFKSTKADTSLYFLILEKVAVSLPTKFLSNPKSGSVLIGDYRFGSAHFPEVGIINRYFICHTKMKF